MWMKLSRSQCRMSSASEEADVGDVSTGKCNVLQAAMLIVAAVVRAAAGPAGCATPPMGDPTRYGFG